ncbi:MAG: 5-(carboxyamino)imidazole ribonucleotide synthase [Thermoanaerobaculia bacterium]
MTPILPGATLGVLGGGQLGRMFAIAARQMGYRVHTFSPEGDTPTGQVSDREITAPYENLDAVRSFARGVDVVTFEFENVPGDAARAAEEIVPVRPAPSVLQTVQHRLREKTFLRRTGFPVPDFESVASADDLRRAVERIGAPAMLKTAGSGYDGKGQARILTASDAPAAWDSIGRAEAILEKFVDFEKEVSVVAARGADGSFNHFGVIENAHRAGILDVSMAPAAVDPPTARQAVEIARGVLEALSVVGVMCIELFVTRGGGLLVNELAPRPHNSGHLTVDACTTSQFEQQLRAVCGLPLGSARFLSPAAMANLLGELWGPGEPDWLAVCARPEIQLHLYGKTEARPGRKMGHLTALAATSVEARRAVLEAREVLSPVAARL